MGLCVRALRICMHSEVFFLSSDSTFRFSICLGSAL
jgi:hypothetical protein